jgi:hypothetical protein
VALNIIVCRSERTCACLVCGGVCACVLGKLRHGQAHGAEA